MRADGFGCSCCQFLIGLQHQNLMEGQLGFLGLEFAGGLVGFHFALAKKMNISIYSIFIHNLVFFVCLGRQ